MFRTNDYFDGRVKSITYVTEKGKASLGVMAPGEYEFSTSSIEYITVVSGCMEVQFPGETKWNSYKPFETFIVIKDSFFKVRVSTEMAYKCQYK